MVERTSRETGSAVDIDILKRKSWNELSAEFVRISAPALYDFKITGSWAHLLLLDLYRNDGETIIGGSLRTITRDLRNKMIFAPPGCSIHGWCALRGSGSVTTLAMSPSIFSQLDVDLESLAPRADFDDTMLSASAHRIQKILFDQTRCVPGYVETVIDLIGFDLRHAWQLPNAIEPVVGALNSDQLRLLTEYIDAHLSEKPSIAHLAAMVNLSRFHFMRSFKLATGTPPHQFIITRRLQRAKELLLESDFSIASIAHETGFGTPVQLARAFRRIIGITPSEYRRNS